MYVFVCMCVCVRACARVHVHASVCVCMCVVVQTLTDTHSLFMKAYQKHIFQTKAISQRVGVCVCKLQTHILTELLSVCYEFGLCPTEQCHMTGRPDSPKHSYNPKAELHSSAEVI